MCDKKDLNVFEDIVGEFMDEGRMFTAFDVTLESKRRGCKERHRNVKRDIHDICFGFIVDGEEYERTLTTLKNDCRAFVYHPIGEDPDEYLNKDDNKVDGKVRIAVPDHRNRLCVPSEFTRGINAKPGDFVQVVYDDGRVMVKNCDNDDDDGFLNKVDSYGNVRISKHVFKRANMAGAKGYTLSVVDDGKSIEIKL